MFLYGNSDKAMTGVLRPVRTRTKRLSAAAATLAALVCVMTACAPGDDLPLLQSQNVGAGYTLSTGDQLRVTTYGEANLSGEFGIDDSGYIALPLLGPIPASGLTSRTLADHIAATMREKKLLADPSVVVEVVRYRPIYVLGEVQHPGFYAYQPHMTFLNAVALAGGFTARAVKTRAIVTRVGSGDPLRGKVDTGSRLDPGDVITVPERAF